MDHPLVTVIIPCYNMEPYLAQTLDSVIRQTHQNLEILVVDDGSKDRTAEIAREHEKRDSRIKLLTQANKGASAARNLGLGHAGGKYIAFTDGDDWWDPTKIEKHVKHLESDPSVGCSYSATQFVTLDGKLLHCRFPKTKNLSDYYLYCRNPITNGSTPVFRREIFDEHRFDENKPRNNDVDCWLRICFTPPRKWKLEGIHEALTYYRVTPGSLSDRLDKHYDACLHTWQKSYQYAPDIAKKFAKLAEAFQLRNYARRAFSMRQGTECRRFMRQAMKTDMRMFLYEPVMTGITLAAVMLSPLMPKKKTRP
ncbi:MAG: glycosyltransferase family 2 protein [Prosthecobacter sp.]